MIRSLNKSVVVTPVFYTLGMGHLIDEGVV